MDDLSYFEDEEFHSLLKQYEQAMEETGSVYMDADELTDIAEYYMVHNQEGKANEAIQLAISMHPDSVDPQIFLARQHMFHNNLAEAHRICDAIQDQDDREVHFLNAELLIREDKVSVSMNHLKEAYERVSDDKALFLYDCAGVFQDYALWDEALEWAEKLQKEFPDFEKTEYLLSDLFISMGNYEDAIPKLNAILDKDPYDIESWNLLAESQAAQENYHEAIESTEYVLAIEENNKRALITQANCLFHLNQLEAAHKLYQACLEQYPEEDTIYYLDAVCLTNMERFQEAAVQLNKANEVSKEMSQDQLHIYLQQAYVESKLRHLDTALNALKKAKDLTTDEVSIEYPLLIGQIYLENELYTDAEEAFKKAIDESPDRKHTLTMIGIAFGECMRFSEAAEILEAMMSIYANEDHRAAIPYLAFCYYNLGDNEKYLKYLKDSAQVSRETTEFLFSEQFPGIIPEEYYLYAYKNIYGRFPNEGNPS